MESGADTGAQFEAQGRGGSQAQKRSGRVNLADGRFLTASPMRSGGTLREFAPAKINLFLHVGPLGADDYHPVHSLMAFTDVGDELRLDPADRMEFTAARPFASALAPQDTTLLPTAPDPFLAPVSRPLAPFPLTPPKR